jgi:antitoxin HicB
MIYPAILKEAGDSWIVTFPDLPDATASGASREEAMQMAPEALQTAIEFYLDDQRAVPQPSKVAPGQEPVELAQDVAMKVLLMNAFVNPKSSS